MIRLAGQRGQAFITKASAKLLARPLSLTSARLAADEDDKSKSNKIGESEFKHSEDLARERYDLRANEDVDRKRARLLYQSKKRGMLENGVILASFADKYLESFDDEQLDQYDRLINLPSNDWDIFYWATKTKPTPPEYETAVMQKLRSHLNKKVSKENRINSNTLRQDKGASGGSDSGNDNKDNDGRIEPPPTQSILDGRRPDDVVMPASKKRYELDIDPSAVNLVDYKKELFDDRTKSLGSRGDSIVMMTEWRRQFFEKRLRRVISSPVSVRNMADRKETSVYSQKVEGKKIATEALVNTELIDSPAERSLKHHNFVQYLLGHQFTDQLDEYEAEAEAWSNALWIRNYGKFDAAIAPSEARCTKCQTTIHCCDSGLSGYVPKELFAKIAAADGHDKESDLKVICQRCNFADTYQTNLDAQLDEANYVEMLKKFKTMKPSVICLVVDLTDFPNGILEGLVDITGTRHKIIIVGNKIDLLPLDGPNMIGRVTNCLRANLAKLRPRNRNIHINDIVILSARTGFGVETLVSKLATLTEIPQDVYILGCVNSGKSTLFNALLQSDISAARDVDLLSRVSTEKDTLNSGISMLKFPMSRPEGWEIELKKRRTERVLRNTEVLDESLVSTTECRQSTMPHMSMLIDRLEFPAIHTVEDGGTLSSGSQDKVDSMETSIVSNTQQKSTDVETVKFSDDHPFQKIKHRELLSATEENYSDHPFLFQTPSLANRRDQLHDLLTNAERLEVFANETLVPRQYTLRPLQSIFIAGLARLDLLTATSYVTVTMLASKYLPIHVISTRKADQFYETFLGSPYLGVPFGDSERLKAWPKLVKSEVDFELRRTSDIVLGSAGWAMVGFGVDQECIVRGWTPEGRGISHRWPPLLPHANKIEWRGKKIRDTPLFKHPQFSINHASVGGQ